MNKALFLFSLFGFLFILNSCEKNYERFEYISEQTLQQLPFKPGEKLVFKKNATDSVIFYTEKDFTRRFYYTWDGLPEESHGPDPNVYREKITLNSRMSPPLNNNCFTQTISITDGRQSGYEYELLDIHLFFDGSDSKIVINSEDYHYNVCDLFEDYFEKLDSVNLAGRMFYDVYSSKVFFYSYKKGIIGFQVDSTTWINAKYF